MQDLKIQLPIEMFSPAAYMHIEENYPLGSIELSSQSYTFDDELRLSVDITNTGDAFLVTGKVEGEATTECSRCLEDTQVGIDGMIEGYYLINPESQIPDDLENDEFEYLPESKVIDLAPLIDSAIKLDLSFAPICSETCKGLCPKCGTNLNTGSCDCSTETDIDPTNPFSILKDYEF